MGECLGYLGGQDCGHHLQHQHGGTGVLQGQRLLAQFGRCRVAPALHAVTAQRVHGLRCQPQVGTDGNTTLHQETHGLGRPAATFEFDHVGTRLQQGSGALQRLLTRLLVAAERQVTHHPGGALGAAQAPGHTFGVVTHGLQAHTHGAV